MATAPASESRPRSNWVMWAVLVAVCGLALYNSRPRESAVPWIDNWANGLATAVSTNRPIMVEFYGPGCTYCVQMDRHVFSKAEVGQALADWVPIKVDATANPRTAAQYDVDAWPTFVALRPNGEAVARAVGGMNANQFLDFVKKAREQLSSGGLNSPPERG